MATCKELNDEVDGNKDEMSTSIQGSMDDGQECCSTDDSDTSDIDSDATKGIDIVVHYQKKIRKIKHDLTKQIHVPLTWERNLKLQYIYNNQDILQPKVDELRKLADKADINRGIVNVYFGKLEDETVIDSLKNSIENILFDQTDHLALSWFPIPSSLNSSEFREELKAMLPDSELGMKQQLYVDTSDATFVRFVHDENVIDKVSDLFNEVFLKAKANTMSGASTDSIQLPFVYFDMLKKQNMLENVTKAFPGVCLLLDAIESEEILRIKLKGNTEVLQRAKTMIHDTFIKPLTHAWIMFDDIVDFCEQVDIVGVVKNILETDKASDICWTVNKYTRNIHICGKSADQVLLLDQGIKTCIEKRKVDFKNNMPTAEKLNERLEKMVNEHKTTASSRSISTFRLMATSEGIVLFTTGWKKQNDYLLKVISKELESGHETNTTDLKSQTKNMEEVCTTESTPSMNLDSEIRATNPHVNLKEHLKNPEFSTADEGNQVTAEQLALNNLIHGKERDTEDSELKIKIHQIMDLTGCSQDKAEIALHDNQNDKDKAVNMVLEDKADEGEWQESGKKKKKPKQEQPPPVQYLGFERGRGRAGGWARRGGRGASTGGGTFRSNPRFEKNNTITFDNDPQIDTWTYETAVIREKEPKISNWGDSKDDWNEDIDSWSGSATAEQLALNNLIHGKERDTEDSELKIKIHQIMDLTGCSQDKAEIALLDNHNDKDKAVKMVLEGKADEGEWQESGKKKKKPKQEQPPPVQYRGFMRVRVSARRGPNRGGRGASTGGGTFRSNPRFEKNNTI